MATIGEVNAISTEKEEGSYSQNLPKKIFFGVFFDGTSNNMIQIEAAKRIRNRIKERQKKIEQNPVSNEVNSEFQLAVEEKGIFENGANVLRKEGQLNGSKGYSNIAILHSIYNGVNKDDYKGEYDIRIFNIYVEGAGTNAEHYEPDTSVGIRKNAPKFIKDKTIEKVTTWKGGVSGRGYSGVVNLVSKAVEMVSLRLDDMHYEDNETEIHFDVFGFSRGATCARLFSFLIARKDDSGAGELPCEKDFSNSYISAKRIKNNKLVFIDELVNKNIKVGNITVDFLGIFDTVSSIGGIRTESYENNTIDFGLYSPSLDRVKHTFHICAMDEYRAHFALTDIGSECNKERSAEIFIPGCHSDIGGGYIDGVEEFDLPVEVVKTDFSENDTVLPINSKLNPLYMPLEYVSSDDVHFGRLKDTMSKYSQDNLGWLGKIGCIEEGPITLLNRLFPQTIKVKRRSYKGYSNISLQMMYDRSKNDTNRDVFRRIPKPEGFTVSENLKQLFGETMISELISRSGRHFYYPGGKYNSKEYLRLREYLHFSAKKDLGHDMSKDDKDVVRRYVYYGNKDDNKRHFMSEYNLKD